MLVSRVNIENQLCLLHYVSKSQTSIRLYEYEYGYEYEAVYLHTFLSPSPHPPFFDKLRVNDA